MTININKKVAQFFMYTLFSATLVSFVMANLSNQKVEAAPATFTVTNTNATGAGSLAEAISDANGNGNPSDQDIIEFDIASSGDQTIEPTSTLSITQSVLINGYTQADASENSSTAPEPFNGLLRVALDLSTSGTITVTSNNVTLQGLIMYGSATNIVEVTDVDAFKLLGSYVRVSPNGLISSGLNNSYNGDNDTGGIVLSNASNAQIGGSNPAQRNILGHCAGSCIKATGNSADNLVVKGNYIGIGSDGHTDLSAGKASIGILLASGADNAQIGGTEEGDPNIIAHLQAYAISAQDVTGLTLEANQILEQIGGGILLGGVTEVNIGSGNESGRNIISGTSGGTSALLIDDSSDTSDASSNINVSNNYFGVAWDGTTSFPNNNSNIRVQGNSEYVLIKENLLWNVSDTEGSVILQNGVVITESAQNIAIIGNSLKNNDLLGIDLNNDGVTANDSGDVDNGPNNQLNFPSNLSTSESGGNTQVSYTLDVPAGDYRIEYFSNTTADPLGYGEGETFLGFQNITHAGNGIESFSRSIAGTGFKNVTAIATEIDDGSPNGYGSSSEFSSIANTVPPNQPIVDLGTSITLKNPEDVAIGANLNYDITLTNYGQDSIDISTYDASLPSKNGVLNLFIDEDLAYVSTSLADISCFSVGPISIIGPPPQLSNHGSSELVVCGYSGGGTHILDKNESITITVTVQVKGSSDLNFTNYVQSVSQEYDPDYKYVTSTSESGNDIIDEYLSSYAPNNFSQAAYPISDIGIEKELLNIDDLELETGNTLSYEFTIRNEGTETIDLNNFDGSGANQFENSLISDVLPPDLAYVSIDNDSFSCTWYGEGSASTVGNTLKNHTEYGLLECIAPNTYELDPDESATFTMRVVLTDDPGDTFTNYAIGAFGSNSSSDPDYLQLNRAYNNVTDDSQLDYIEQLLLANNNVGNSFASATYTTPGTENPDSTNGLLSAISNLANTGLNALIPLGAGILLLVLGLLSLKNSRLKKYENV